MAREEYLTLQCSSETSYNKIALSKEGESDAPQVSFHQPHAEYFHDNFILGSVNFSSDGQYRCLGAHTLSSVWSAPSDTLDILITVSPSRSGEVIQTFVSPEGFLFKPILRALPRNVVMTGNQVTFFCQGPLEAKEYRLCKEGIPDCLLPTTLIETENLVKFSISSVEWNNGGHYRCEYKSPNGALEHRDYLDLVVTVGPVTPNQRWRFTCYGYYLSSSQMSSVPSRILELLVSGVYNKPTLSTMQNPVVNLRGSVTLSCTSSQRYDWFILTKNGQKFSIPLSSRCTHTGMFLAEFPVGPVTSSQRWRFRCYGYYTNNSQVWSEGSDVLELLVSGEEASDSLWYHGAPDTG
ncbi:leukocyte immunoglobulin-like receptor subfamily A member 5 [Peromyscus maniculatus bairdii]|uniref:leukocyte immunoglobulin-like receptor subfamily A member 5 n=1 Tax=Peromyscus maniculatus bairdii TaxID=230844 RepID=UPI003FD483A8